MRCITAGRNLSQWDTCVPQKARLWVEYDSLWEVVRPRPSK